MTFTSWMTQGLHAHTLRKPYYLSIYHNRSLLVCFCCWLVPKLCLTLSGLLCPWDFPGKNNGEGCHFLLPLLVICFKHRHACLSSSSSQSIPPSHLSLVTINSFSKSVSLLLFCKKNSFVSFFFFRFHIEAIQCIYILIQWNISQPLKTMK